MNLRGAPQVGVEDEAPVDVFSYHQRSKHRMDAYARGPDTIDWEQQPNPFRHFSGTAQLQLSLSALKEQGEALAQLQAYSLSDLWLGRNPPSLGLGLEAIALWLRHSLALSAWKQYGGSRWSLRCNPSSGNLHPTEAYLVMSGVEGCADGVYHYRPEHHALELRCEFSRDARLPAGIYIGLSSIHWREAWKYGERAYRYCQLDIGHALAALACAAAPLGWQLEYLPVADAALEAVLGLDRDADFIAGEEEWGECLLRVHTGNGGTVGDDIPGRLQRAAAGGSWHGAAELLDRHHFYSWPVIAQVAEQVRREGTQRAAEAKVDGEKLPSALAAEYREPLYRLALQRRSAQAYDGVTDIGMNEFFTLLDHLLPRPEQAPWAVLPGPASVHCVFFVHRVEGLAPGLYVLPRSANGEALLRSEMRESFEWERVGQAPAHLPFYRLISAKAERTAAKLCCQQAIAGNGAFSLGMLAEFSGQLEDAPWRYRELFWEAGALGQALYLEAEGIGLQGTGIGCFFDDAVHELLGIEGDALQSLYHFTIGGALHDPRIITMPAYSERRR